MNVPLSTVEVASALPGVLAERSRAAFERLLAPDVRWGGCQDSEQTCHNRAQAGRYYGKLLTSGVRLSLAQTDVSDDQILAWFEVSADGHDPDHDQPHQTQVLLTVRDGLVVNILQVNDEPQPVIELLFFTGCPNHDAFLPHLRQLLDSHHVYATVRLVEVTDDDDAQRLRFLGSPTLRIDGYDVEPEADNRSSYGLQCRLYRTPDGATGTPTDAWILAALAQSSSANPIHPHASPTY